MYSRIKSDKNRLLVRLIALFIAYRDTKYFKKNIILFVFI